MKGFGRYLLGSLDHIIQEKRKTENLEPTERSSLRSLDLCNELNQDQEAPWKDKQDGIDGLVASQRRTARYCARHHSLNDHE